MYTNPNVTDLYVTKLRNRSVRDAMSLSPIRTHGKFADAAYEAIRTGIRMGHIPPGSRLHEHELAGQLGTSKTPVREALG
ncbi:MAG: GntR family transcriptional regulator, partial [Chloroflexota bacterium]